MIKIPEQLETKGDFMKAVFSEQELRNVDSAIPQELADTMRQYGLDPFWIVYNYNKDEEGHINSFGTPVHLAEKFIKKYILK